MADPRFFQLAGPFTLGEIARRIGVGLATEGEAGRQIVDVRSLGEAGPEHLTFLYDKRYADTFAASRAGACIVMAEMVAQAPPGMALLVARKPRLSFAKAAALFYPEPEAKPIRHPGRSSTHPRSSNRRRRSMPGR